MDEHFEDGRNEEDLDRELPPLLPKIPSPDDDPISIHTAAVGDLKVRVVNKPMIKRGESDEGVAGCSITLGTVVGRSNAYGNATLDVSQLVDGVYDLIVTAPVVSSDAPGPDLTVPDGEQRVWAPFETQVRKTGDAVEPTDANGSVELINGVLRIGLRPLWMQAVFHHEGELPRAEMIVVHHTASRSSRTDLDNLALGNRRVSAHYLVPPNGETIKLVKESDQAWHAGRSNWQGRGSLNRYSVGIEITHLDGPYTDAQVDAVEELVGKLTAAFPSIETDQIIGHSDISLTKTPPRRLGNKPVDPSSRFPWERLEANGWSLIPTTAAMPNSFLGSFFSYRPAGSLRTGDNDSTKTYNGEHLPDVGNAVEELQTNLRAIGYHVGNIDGDFGKITWAALLMFQAHMFSGSRHFETGENSGDGKCDLRSAKMLSAVLGGPPLVG